MFFYFLILYISFFYFLGTIITVANVGDSRVILGYKKDITPYPIPMIKSQLSEDDTPGTSIEDNSSRLMAQANSSSLDDKRSSPLRSSQSPSKTLQTSAIGLDSIDLSEMKEEEEDKRVWGVTTTLPLSKDHKPDDPKERDCILKAGTSLYYIVYNVIKLM